MRQRVTILGSTGSIGRSTLQVLDALSDRFEVVGLAAGTRAAELAAQAERWRPGYIALGDVSAVGGQALAKLGGRGGARVLTGPDGLVDLVEASRPDIVVSAIVGTAGLMATIKAAEMGVRVAIANKETLVIAGSLVTQLARHSGAELIPVDSEHSAIFQALHAGSASEVRCLYLTSSGGPLRTWTPEQIRDAALEQVLDHPVWTMGPKITIDSATMMNKALEVVEARWLFDVPADRLQVLIHPEAIVHSMVEFCDGCFVAQLGSPDMRLPIQYALTYPQRVPSCGNRLDAGALRQLNFEPPDEERFPALRLGFDVARRGGSAGAVLNAANEVAVAAYRQGRIRFSDITELVAGALRRHRWLESPDLGELLEADAWARNEVHACLKC